MLYERKIKYFSYMENGERVRGAGFAKLEVRDKLCFLTMQINNLGVSNYSKPVFLLGGERECQLCELQVKQGRGMVQFQLPCDNLCGGIAYNELRAICIPIAAGKEVYCEIQEQTRTAAESETAGKTEQVETPKVNAAQRKRSEGNLTDTRLPGARISMQETKIESRSYIPETRLAETKLAESKTSEAQTLEAQTLEVKTSEAQTLEPKTSESKTSEAQTLEAKILEAKILEAQTLEAKTSGVKTSEPKTPEAKTLEAKMSETKILEAILSEPKFPTIKFEKVLPEELEAIKEYDEEVSRIRHDIPIKKQLTTIQPLEKRVNIKKEAGANLQNKHGSEQKQQQITSKEKQEKISLKENKWKQLSEIYKHIAPFQDERDYLSIGPGDFVIFPEKYYKLVNNSFLLHGYYNYKHLILTKMVVRGETRYYMGVPGNFYEREKQVALMFGFESFECQEEPARAGDYGYYMIRVEL